MIEKSLERIADALEKLVVLAENPKPSPSDIKAKSPGGKARKVDTSPKPNPNSKPKDESEITFAMLRDVMGRVIKAKGSDTAKEIIAAHGAEKLSALGEDTYPAVVEAANAALAQ